MTGKWTCVAFGCVMYGAVIVGWLVRVARELEPFAIALLAALHACLALCLVSWWRALLLPAVPLGWAAVSERRFCPQCAAWQPHPQALYIHSPLLKQCVGPGNWRPFGRFLLYGGVCSWTVSVGAVLRMCEMAGFAHAGPVSPGSDTSLLVLASLLAAEVGAALVLPMFVLALSSLLRWRAAMHWGGSPPSKWAALVAVIFT